MIAYIHDGYTVHGYIAEVPRLYPAVRFVYRPILAQNRAVIYKEIAQAQDARRTETIAAQAVSSAVMSWDVVNHKGEAVHVEVSEILRLQPTLGTKIFQVVMGNSAPDEDPNVTNQDRDDASEAALQSALSGQGPEDTAAKNSGKG